METALQINLPTLMGVVTHLLISCSTHNQSSWQYLQSIPLCWQIPATSPASTLTSSPCIVIITCSGFPTWKPELTVKSCQIIHSTWQVGRAFLSVFNLSHFWLLNLQSVPTCFLFYFFIFYKCCCKTFFFLFLFYLVWL